MNQDYVSIPLDDDCRNIDEPSSSSESSRHPRLTALADSVYIHLRNTRKLLYAEPSPPPLPRPKPPSTSSETSHGDGKPRGLEQPTRNARVSTLQEVEIHDCIHKHDLYFAMIPMRFQGSSKLYYWIDPRHDYFHYLKSRYHGEGFSRGAIKMCVIDHHPIILNHGALELVDSDYVHSVVNDLWDTFCSHPDRYPCVVVRPTSQLVPEDEY